MHVIKNKTKLILRCRKIKGQIEAIEKALESDVDDCSAILQNVASCRGALNGLMAELIEGHVNGHVLDADGKHSQEQAQAAETLLQVIRAYLK